MSAVWSSQTEEVVRVSGCRARPCQLAREMRDVATMRKMLLTLRQRVEGAVAAKG